MSLLLAMAAEFALVNREDPITLERQSVFGIEQEGDLFGLMCRPGKGEIEIFFAPAYYRGAFNGQGLWAPRADSRFGKQPEADKDAWYFGDDMLTFVGANTNLWRQITSTAEFIDRLAKDEAFNIRWEASPSVVRTVTMAYSIDVAQLRQFVGNCGPKKVISKLRAMGSSATPE